MENKKEKLLVQFSKAFVNGDHQFMLNQVTEDFHWIMIGKKEIKGKAQFADALKDMKNCVTSELELVDVITHGKKACVNGNMKVGSPKAEDQSFSFCDVYEFSSFKEPKIKRMTSYLIER
ncbi:nuclear transport factor 2 family protein [Zunongwangia pacifica]|uniref:Nuclear transport factor 2 family protein n=1 Tax=Zunongwangia pacifica TaxID=2911062 RepID=A0A9X1ZUD8_9FLAO|nr:nuclear transport factor 2 family protein [Zunongwangia pacifica]MCL6220296.1 nuclear transport factor 2 family protein [Zunongwangia pacifica]